MNCTHQCLAITAAVTFMEDIQTYIWKRESQCTTHYYDITISYCTVLSAVRLYFALSFRHQHANMLRWQPADNWIIKWLIVSNYHNCFGVLTLALLPGQHPAFHDLFFCMWFPLFLLCANVSDCNKVENSSNTSKNLLFNLLYVDLGQSLSRILPIQWSHTFLHSQLKSDGSASPYCP